MPTPTLHPYQQVAKDFILNHDHCALFLPMGLGKAQPLDALVLTTNGFVQMGKITTNHHVYTPSGDVARVSGVYPQGTRPIYRITGQDGRIAEGDLEHLWPVHALDQSGKPTASDSKLVTTSRLKELVDKQMTPHRNAPPVTSWALKLPNPVDLLTWPTDLDPYFIGRLVAHGTYTERTATITINGLSKHTLARLTQALPPTATMLRNEITFSDSTVISELERLRVIDNGVLIKTLPIQLAVGTVEQRQNLLDGLLTNIRLKDNREAMIRLTSATAANPGLVTLVRSLGGTAAYHLDTKPPERFTLYLTLPTPQQPIYMPIIRVAYSHEAPAQCIMVDHPDHEYVTDSFTPTHNTLVTLDALNTIRPSGHILVSGPGAIVKSTWLDEIEKWGYEINTKSLITKPNGVKLSRKARLELYDELYSAPASMYFINQELITDLVDHFTYTPDPKHPNRKEYRWPFPTVVIDEMQGYKSNTAERFKSLVKVQPHIKRLIGLTGTPTPNGPIDLWSQSYLLDQGAALETSKSKYLSKYFVVTRYRDGNIPIKWAPKPGARDQIYDRLKDTVVSIESSAIKLPPSPPPNNVYAHLTEKEMTAYKRFQRSLVLPFVDKANNVINITAANAAVLQNQLLQYASGTIYVDRQRNFEIVHQHKVELLANLIENTDSPVLVAYRFVAEHNMLLDILNKKPYKLDLVPFDGSRNMIHNWNKQKYRAMLLQPASAAHGLNLQDGGHTIGWFSLPWSLEHYAQTNARLARQGQKHPVMIHRFITKGTFDENMPGMLREKAHEQDYAIHALRAHLGPVALDMGLSVDIDDDLTDSDITPSEEDIEIEVLDNASQPMESLPPAITAQITS